MHRLPAPFGSRIDRGRPIRFTFDGRAIDGFVGDTVASALLANGETVLSRSFKYHRPRGVLTMAGGEANTLVQLPGEPNVFADLRAAADGLDVRAQNVAGSLARDRYAILDRLGRFLPSGFYYEAFHRPAGAWGYWEPRIRRMSGLGAIDPQAHGHGVADKQFLFCDVLVIGAGPAGVAAALAAHDAGADVLLVDEQPRPGGALAYRRPDEGDVSPAALQRELAARPGIRVMGDTRCTGAFTDNWIAAIRGERLFKIRAKRIVLATGAHEQIAVFRNNDLPGVMLGSAAQRLVREFAVAPGTRAVVATGTDDGYRVASDLRDAGIDVEAIVDFRAAPSATAADIPIIAGHGIVQAHPGPGRRSVAGVGIAPIEGRGRLARGVARDLVCDLVCLSAGWMPAFQLAAQAGAKLRYDETRTSFVLGGVPEGWHVAGSARGLRGQRAVIADGRRAGILAAQETGFGTGAPLPVVPDDESGGDHDWPVFPHPRGRDFVDFDEDLQVKDIQRACELGYDDIQLVKRFTTLGMGPSQGRHSALPGARVVAAASGRAIDETNITTVRPPLGGEKLKLLAGRAFDPVRHTPMHHRHLEAGAQMVPAGLWMRPAYYAEPRERDAAIAREAGSVRTGVGVIDVSTLGGLDIRGPDAAELIERLYTGSFRQQKPGTTRYGVMTNEMGTIIDDGVNARFHERHFYVTATTTGVDAVYRKILWWNAQWRLDVDVTNVTATYAAVNLAGPRSREVLSRLCTGMALGPQDFPYMAARLARVAGIEARIMRVGFVGELGYEIHVPAGCGEALWDALLEAGKADGIRPFGVEAQRLLRLEKGHFIVGQDTDGLSHPDEARCAWAVAMKKPFFVGQRAIAMIRRAPPDRSLVGFTLPIDGPVPEEGCVLLEGERITGYVTSIGRSASVGAIIGLGLGSRRQAEAGAVISVKLGDGRIVEARGATLPFYDPDNLRQKM